MPASRPPLRFLDLPGEIKNTIYDLVLQDYGLKLDHTVRNLVQLKQPPPADLSISITRSKNALLGTCQQIRAEAMPFVAKNATLDIRNHFNREDPLRVLQPVLLNNIKRLEIDIEAFAHIKRSLLPSLDHVLVVCRVDAVGDMVEALHLLHCPSCGHDAVFYHQSLMYVLDWRWIRQQINHLSKEEGWDVYLKVLWETSDPGDSYVKVIYELESEKALSMEGFVYDEPIDVTNWSSAQEQLRELRLMFEDDSEEGYWSEKGD